MLSMNINHPDIEEFITKKQDLSKVTGANVSVQITDDFMNAVENDEDYLLRWPCDVYDNINKSVQLLPTLEYNILTEIPEVLSNGIAYVKKIKAKELWDSIIQCAWNTAEPGLMFIDRIHDYSPDGVYDEYKAVSTNPCGRQFCCK